MTILEQVSKPNRKKLVKAATELHKSGIKPTGQPQEGRTLRPHERRQMERALGYRGSKAKRHNLERQRAKVQQVLLVEEALDAAEYRINHPIKSRLRRS